MRLYQSNFLSVNAHKIFSGLCIAYILIFGGIDHGPDHIGNPAWAQTSGSDDDCGGENQPPCPAPCGGTNQPACAPPCGGEGQPKCPEVIATGTSPSTPNLNVPITTGGSGQTIGIDYNEEYGFDDPQGASYNFATCPAGYSMTARPRWEGVPRMQNDRRWRETSDSLKGEDYYVACELNDVAWYQCEPGWRDRVLTAVGGAGLLLMAGQLTNIRYLTAAGTAVAGASGLMAKYCSETSGG